MLVEYILYYIYIYILSVVCLQHTREYFSSMHSMDTKYSTSNNNTSVICIREYTILLSSSMLRACKTY